MSFPNPDNYARDCDCGTSGANTTPPPATIQAEIDSLDTRVTTLENTNDVIVSSGGIAALTTEQQALINEGSWVVTSDGREWVYSGTGSKVLEASYFEVGAADYRLLRASPATNSTNIAAGNSALSSTTIGTNNTAVGVNTLTANQTGSYNTAVGSGALQTTTSLSAITAVGGNALKNLGDGESNVAVGFNALLWEGTTGTQDTSFSTAVGTSALQNHQGSYNTAIGNSAMGRHNSSAPINPPGTGTSNVCVGNDAGRTIDSGSDNTLIGTAADLISPGSNLVVCIGSGTKANGGTGSLNIGGTGSKNMSSLTTTTAPTGASTYLRIWLNGVEYRILARQP